MKEQKKVACIKCTKKTENKVLDDGTEVKIVSFLANGEVYAFHRFMFPPKGKAFVEVWVLEENVKKFIKVSTIALGG